MGWLLRKIRGLLGLGVAGGVAGAVLGTLWWFGASIVGGAQVAFGSLPWTVALWTGFGAFATTGLGVFLATVSSGRGLQELSPWRAAALGAFLGAIAPVGLVFVVTGSIWAPSLGLFAGASGVLGGLLGSGLVRMAQGAEARELEAGDEPGAIGPPR